jgi:hypothetical protein
MLTHGFALFDIDKFAGKKDNRERVKVEWKPILDQRCDGGLGSLRAAA